MTPISLGEQIAAARRELGVRRRVYQNRVATGRMTPHKAAYEIAAMEAIVDTLEADARRERLL